MGLVSTAFFMFFVVFSLLLTFYMRGGNDDSWFKVDRQMCHNFVLVYYLSILVFGWYINCFMIRSWFIAKFAGSEAAAAF
jgi:hypothetical protein